jgi:osmotically-inducible protein OsmY
MSTRNFRIDPAHQPGEQHPVAQLELLAERSRQVEHSVSPSAVSDPHQVERSVRHRLLNFPGVSFSSLVVRRFSNGLCLQGTIEIEDADSDQSDVCQLAREVAGVEQIINQLVVRCGDRQSDR